MKRFLWFVPFILAFGCNPPDAPAPTPAPVTKPPVVATTTPTKPPIINPDDNPNRIYQVKDLKVVNIDAPKKQMHLWVMDTDGKQQEGMMFLTDKDVKEDQGMLFMFDDVQPAEHGFWMENTLIPLDIIYIDSQGKVVSIVQGKVKDLTSLPAHHDFKFVIELKKDMAKKIGIATGTLLKIPQSEKS